jgi:hypothetical protein
MGTSANSWFPGVVAVPVRVDQQEHRSSGQPCASAEFWAAWAVMKESITRVLSRVSMMAHCPPPPAMSGPDVDPWCQFHQLELGHRTLPAPEHERSHRGALCLRAERVLACGRRKASRRIGPLVVGRDASRLGHGLEVRPAELVLVVRRQSGGATVGSTGSAAFVRLAGPAPRQFRDGVVTHSPQRCHDLAISSKVRGGFGASPEALF